MRQRSLEATALLGTLKSASCIVQARCAVVQASSPTNADMRAMFSALLPSELASNATLAESLTSATLAVVEAASTELPATANAPAYSFGTGCLMQVARGLCHLPQNEALLDTQVLDRRLSCFYQCAFTKIHLI